MTDSAAVNIHMLVARIRWYARCLKDMQDGRVVRGLAEAKAGYDAALRDLVAQAEQAAASEDALAWAETFLARHDAFLQHQTPQGAYAMKDAADGFRDALAKVPRDG